MNFLFYGFRHSHIFSCYQQAAACPEVQILAALEENEEARRTAEEKLGITFDTGSYQAWLEKPEVDVVAIGGAYGDRGQAAIQALQHGKHVLSDKPICIRMEEWQEIRRLAEEKHLKVGCLLDLRCNPGANRAKELLTSGRLGEVKNISFTGQHYLDYEHRPRWYFEPGMHGGTINDIAIHGIDLISFLTGQKITKIHGARTWNSYAHQHPHFMDCAMFMAEIENGAGVLADVSYAGPSQVFTMPTYWNFKIWCARGLVTFSCTDEHVTVYEDGCSGPEVLPGKMPEQDILEEFLQQIRQDKTAMTEYVLTASEIALRIQQTADGSLDWS